MSIMDQALRAADAECNSLKAELWTATVRIRDLEAQVESLQNRWATRPLSSDDQAKRITQLEAELAFQKDLLSQYHKLSCSSAESPSTNLTSTSRKSASAPETRFTPSQRDWIRRNYDALTAAGWRDPEAPQSETRDECSTCGGTGEVDLTLGGIHTSDPHAPCPDCTPKTVLTCICPAGISPRLPHCPVHAEPDPPERDHVDTLFEEANSGFGSGSDEKTGAKHE